MVNFEREKHNTIKLIKLETLSKYLLMINNVLCSIPVISVISYRKLPGLPDSQTLIQLCKWLKIYISDHGFWKYTKLNGTDIKRTLWR